MINFSGPENLYLTAREKEVLKCIVEGKTNAIIGKELNISAYTAKAHVCSILHKLGVKDRLQAAVIAIREGLV